MKILFDHANPFLLAHGGFQTQIERTKDALESIGVEVEYLRWWDDSQRGDVIHFFGRPTMLYVEQAHQKGMKVVLADLMSAQGARSDRQRLVQQAVMRICKRVLPESFTARLAWGAYEVADGCVALTEWEAELMRTMFQVAPGKLHVVPNGVESEFLGKGNGTRGKWLVCTATVTAQKRIQELAEAAVEASTPLRVVGKPYYESDPYAVRFRKYAQAHPDVLKYEGPINDRNELAGVYREARGFVLLSSYESLSLSALEASASGCPLLLSDQRWARTVFRDRASYCPITPSVAETARHLKRFYDAAPDLPRPGKPKTWTDVAEMLRDVYMALLEE